MVATPSDFQNPEIPTTMREFYMIYFRDSKRLNEKLDELDESHNEDRESFLAVIEEQRAAIQSLAIYNTKHTEKIDQLEKKVNTWNLTNTLAAVGAFIAALFLKGS